MRTRVPLTATSIEISGGCDVRFWGIGFRDPRTNLQVREALHCKSHGIRTLRAFVPLSESYNSVCKRCLSAWALSFWGYRFRNAGAESSWRAKPSVMNQPTCQANEGLEFI